MAAAASSEPVSCYGETVAGDDDCRTLCVVFLKMLSNETCCEWRVRHYMFEVLLSDSFGVCFGPSTGPEIMFYWKFTEMLSHHQVQPPLIMCIRQGARDSFCSIDKKTILEMITESS